MKAALLLFIKAFALFSIPFGILMFLFGMLEGNPNLMSDVTRAATYGFLMSITLVGTHIFTIHKKKLGPITAETLKVTHKKVVISELPKTELIDRLTEDPEWKKFDIRISDTDIRIKTKPSIWTWGEKIRILAQQAVDGKYQYEITSAPDVGTTLVDYGRNLQNVQRLEKLILP